MVKRLLAARDEALTGMLTPLTRDERRALAPALLAARPHDRRDLEPLCRLCQRRACGERCPVAPALR